jgi:hypothetical protein
MSYRILILLRLIRHRPPHSLHEVGDLAFIDVQRRGSGPIAAGYLLFPTRVPLFGLHGGRADGVGEPLDEIGLVRSDNSFDGSLARLARLPGALGPQARPAGRSPVGKERPGVIPAELEPGLPGAQRSDLRPRSGLGIFLHFPRIRSPPSPRTGPLDALDLHTLGRSVIRPVDHRRLLTVDRLRVQIDELVEPRDSPPIEACATGPLDESTDRAPSSGDDEKGAVPRIGEELLLQLQIPLREAQPEDAVLVVPPYDLTTPPAGVP